MKKTNQYKWLTILCALWLSINPTIAAQQKPTFIEINKADYQQKLHGFWLGQSIANWTGLVTEMDKIGGQGPVGKFYTRNDWQSKDQPSIWGQGIPSKLSKTIDFVLIKPGKHWGADDDTDIEYMYQHLMLNSPSPLLSPTQIRTGWLTHIYSDNNTPFKDENGKPENYLWVSNQQAFDLMNEQKLLPPDTSDPKHNPHFDMIDAQLSTEIFGLFAPANPQTALKLAHLPVRTVARKNAAWAAEFYVIMHSLSATIDNKKPLNPQLQQIAHQARAHLPNDSYSAAMFDFVWKHYNKGTPWETLRDSIYQRYQVEQQDGYNITGKNLYCNGCFASGINFAASLISLFYGEGDYKQTVKLAVLMGWDSDNPAATWGGLIGFIIGEKALRKMFNTKLSSTFNIHRTRTGFANNGIDNFDNMALDGVKVTLKVILELLDGKVTDKQSWLVPVSRRVHREL